MCIHSIIWIKNNAWAYEQSFNNWPLWQRAAPFTPVSLQLYCRSRATIVEPFNLRLTLFYFIAWHK